MDKNKAIAKWDEVGTALAVYTEKLNEETLGKCIAIIFDAIKYVAPYASTVTSIIEQMVITDQVMVELNKINDKLFSIDKKLDKIVGQIKEELKVNEYKKYLNKLNTIQALYTRFIQTPNTLTLDALIEQSKRNEMFEFINWIHREVTAQSLNPIIDYMKADYDYPKFMKWTKLILAHFAQSMLLHGIGVQLIPNVSEDILQQTIQNDTQLFEKNIRDMQNVFTAFIECLKQSYLSKLKEKLIEMMRPLPSLDEQALANVLYDYASDNYPFREWFVCAVKTRDSKIYGSPADFYYNIDDEQTIRLIVCEKDSNTIAMGVKEYSDIQWAMTFEKYSYKNARVIFVTSTLAEECQYRHDVNKHLASIDEHTYCKYKGWSNGYRLLCHNTAKYVMRGLPQQYSSQILCLRLYDEKCSIKSVKYGYKYCDRAMICFHRRPVKCVKGIFAVSNFHVEIITIKKD